MTFRQKDIVVIGAGPAGLLAALAFMARKFTVIVCETAPQASAAAQAGRSAALFGPSVALLQELDLWPQCKTAAAPLRALQFIDATGSVMRAPDVIFNAEEIGEAAFGYNIPNAELIRVLRSAVVARAIDFSETGHLAALNDLNGNIAVHVENGTKIEAGLAVAADGRNSASRRLSSIRTLSWAYGQTAIATSFSHARAHDDRCIELHRAGGPFTLVPLPGNRSSLVWVERTFEADRLMALDDASFADAAFRVACGVLGGIADIAPRAAFPLVSLTARELGKNRTALIGEAAHASPPIGAQGLNLGFRDIAALAKLAAEARDAGEDFGGPDLLERYSRARRADVAARVFGVDLLNRSLLSGFLPLKIGRSAGLFTLAKAGPLRRAFMRAGMAAS